MLFTFVYAHLTLNPADLCTQKDTEEMAERDFWG